MNREVLIEVFSEIGYVFKKALSQGFAENEDCNAVFLESIINEIEEAGKYNPWFTKENVHFTLQAWADTLDQNNLNKYLSSYNSQWRNPKTVSLITAGNIPMVGFHDFLSVLLSGNKALIKQSSKDNRLLPIIAKFIICKYPELKNYIHFTEEKLTNFDAIIATGSNNTSLYFEQYFGKYPHIIRKNRNAVAVLTGEETETELQLLGDDIFRYFGMGCRSVSKIFIPENYDLNKLFKAIYSQKDIINHHKYKNNYDYNRAVYLMGGVQIIENGFVLFKEDINYASPIAVVYYEYYKNLSMLKTKLQADVEQIQCIVSKEGFLKDSVSFGKSQKPELWDYADGVDTMEFLINL